MTTATVQMGANYVRVTSVQSKHLFLLCSLFSRDNPIWNCHPGHPLKTLWFTGMLLVEGTSIPQMQTATSQVERLL